MINDKLKNLANLTQELTAEEKIWFSGYLYGIAGNADNAVSASNTEPTKALPEKITILFGTESGNSKAVANKLGKFLKEKGSKTKVESMSSYKAKNLQKEQYLLVIVSTHGDGEAPDQAKKFYEFIHSSDAPKLNDTNFAVLALGDTSYPLFCQTGVDIDNKLAELGGKRILDVVKADLDFEPVTNQWFDDLVAKLSGSGEVVAPKAILATSGKRDYKGTIVDCVNLNDEGSNKKTLHIEIESEDEIDYRAGDALGIKPYNQDENVKSLIKELKIKESDELEFKDKKATAKELFKKDILITKQADRVKKAISEKFKCDVNKCEDLIDIVKKLDKEKIEFDVNELVKLLDPISPRLYSIASSNKEYDNQCHLLVSIVEYEIDGKKYKGLASNFLDSLKEDDEIEFYIQKNNRFKLPKDTTKDVIMVGPGTGVAPFRAFMQDRVSDGAEGRNWLVFGEQRSQSDFLYQAEWQEYVAASDLNKISLAFSRDQKKKVYVQDKLKEEAKELYKWLESGAYFYVCGAKDPMSKDVEKALIEIIIKEGGKTKEEAQDYLNRLQDEDRYIKDVY